MKNEPLVSIIIPTKNSEKTLEKCLKSIKNQTYPNIQIIVVDNYSTDNTREIAKKYGNVFLKGPERTSQRNYGAKNAKGECLFHIDSDMELTPRVVEECVKETHKGANAIVVPEISVGEGFWAKCKALERFCYIGDDKIEMPRFFESHVFWNVGKYDENIVIGEHRDLLRRIRQANFEILRIDEIIKHHEGKLTLINLIKKRYYWGKMLVRYYKKHKSLGVAQPTLLRPAYFRNWRKLVADPVHTIGFMIMKVCEFVATSIGLVVSFFGDMLSSS